MPASPKRAIPFGSLALAACVVVLLVPVLIAPIPPLTDYPNHLARMWLLSGGAALPAMSALYEVRFDTFTNIGIDLIALTVGKLAGYEVAGRLSVAAAVVLPPLGGALLWRSVHGRFHWWMLSFGLLAWGASLLDAFLNFQIGIGLAMLFAALEPGIGTYGAAGQIVSRAMLSLALLLMHPFAMLFYALLLGALAIGPVIAWDRRYSLGLVRRLVLVGIPLILVAALFILTVPSLPGTQEQSGLRTIPSELMTGFRQFAYDPKKKLFNMAFLMRSYSNVFDAPAILVFLAPIGLAAAMRCLRLHAGLTLLSVGVLAAYLVCPDALLGAAWVDTRFAVMLLFVIAAAAAPDLPRQVADAVVLMLILTFIGRTAVVGMFWYERQADAAAVALVLEAVPPGAAVLPVEQRRESTDPGPPGRFMVTGDNSFRHLAALALPWRQAFVPILFAARGKQPVAVLAPWDQIAEPNGGQLADVHALDSVSSHPPRYLADYVDRWRTRFNYVLVVNADMVDRYGPFVPSAALTLVRDAGFARLYRIIP